MPKPVSKGGLMKLTMIIVSLLMEHGAITERQKRNNSKTHTSNWSVILDAREIAPI